MTDRKIAIYFLTMLGFLGASHGIALTQAPAPAYNPTNPVPATAAELPSVEVAADHRVTFRLHAPEATTVSLNGDFLLGAPAVKLIKGSDGTWT